MATTRRKRPGRPRESAHGVKVPLTLRFPQLALERIERRARTRKLSVRDHIADLAMRDAGIEPE